MAISWHKVTWKNTKVSNYEKATNRSISKDAKSFLDGSPCVQISPGNSVFMLLMSISKP